MDFGRGASKGKEECRMQNAEERSWDMGAEREKTLEIDRGLTVIPP